MSQLDVEKFASEFGVLPTVLLEQLQAAGVRKHMTEDSLTEKDKTQLLEYLRKIHGAKEEKGRISLPRRQTSEIKKADSTGKPRSIQVEVRKKRVFVKGDSTAERKTAEAAAPSAPSAPPPVRTPVIDAAQQALRQEEARRQAELIARQAAELREKRLRERPPVVEVKEPEVPATPPAPVAAPLAEPEAVPVVPGTPAAAPAATVAAVEAEAA